jgi:nickel transport protein
MGKGNMRELALLLCLSGCLFGASALNEAAAHDLWLESAADGYVLYQGHRYSAHDGEEILPYDASFTRRAVCLHAGGRAVLLPLDPSYPARFAGPCDGLLVEASSGTWTTTTEGTRNQPPDGLTGVVHSWQTLRTVKRIDAWGESMQQPAGDALELVPLNDPLALQPRDELRLLVTLEGAPQPGVTVACDGEPLGVTGADGLITLKIRGEGRQLITASTRTPAVEPGIDHVRHAATLQFDIPASPRQ